jgi:hypothetical protein
MFPTKFIKRQREPLLSNYRLLKYSTPLFCALLLACAAGPLGNARDRFYSDQPEKAADILLDAEDVPQRDRLLFFMEKGQILHSLGRYEESTTALLQASGLMDQQEIISLSQQTGSLITSELITEYKGEYSERLWVHTYLIMNYLLLYDNEDALVEAKQALKILTQYPEPLNGDYFTRALIALCYENLLLLNDAYIEYKKLAELMPEPAPVASDLYRLCLKLGYTDEAEHYKNYMAKRNMPFPRETQTGELVLFAGLGRSPIKIPANIVLPPSIRFSFPRYEDRPSEAAEIIVLDSSDQAPSISISTDLNKVARASLQERMTEIIAKETARAASKEAIARAVGRNNEAWVEALTRLVLFLTEEPDTRSWQTLPASLALLRIPLKPGKHNIRALILGKRGAPIEEITLPELFVSSGQKIYYSIRESDGNL